ncbi:MAG: NAD(P)-dependent oxidoreductase [Proteobacteria bacterium]|nr:NAD(P)-dependent oxidoreductase [Pseudomonadota bacterium]
MTGNRIVVTGASSFIGRHLMPYLVQNGYTRLVAVTRSAGKIESIDPSLELAEGDILDPVFLLGLLNTDDVLINLLHIPKGSSEHYQNDNFRVAENLMASARSNRPKLILHCSTTEVVGRTMESSVTEQTTCHPINDYQKLKLAIEHRLLDFSKETGIPVAILRLSEVFGPGGRGLNSIIQTLAQGSRINNLWKTFILGNRRTHYIHISKVLSAFYQVMHLDSRDSPLSLIVADDVPDNHYRRVAREILESYGKKGCLSPVSVPNAIVKLYFRFFKYSLDCSYTISGGKMAEVGVSFSTTFRQDLRSYLDWYKVNAGK